MTTMTRRQAIREARAEADAIIAQHERFARGLDRGPWRDDVRPVDRNSGNTIRRQLQAGAAYAFQLSLCHG